MGIQNSSFCCCESTIEMNIKYIKNRSIEKNWRKNQKTTINQISGGYQHFYYFIGIQRKINHIGQKIRQKYLQTNLFIVQCSNN